MATIIGSPGLTFPDTTTQTTAATTSIPAGTRVAFQQTSAPTGWTKDTTALLDDSVMTLTTGAASSGGSIAFTTWNAVTSSGAYTLATTDLPSHTHAQQLNGADLDTGSRSTGPYRSGAYSLSSVLTASIGTQATGGGGSHSHSLANAVKYNDYIIAVKN